MGLDVWWIESDEGGDSVGFADRGSRGCSPHYEGVLYDQRRDMSGTVTVLIADDHPVFLEGLRMILDRTEFVDVIGQAQDGESAWQMIQEKQPAVAVLDYEIPTLDGISIARRIVRDKLPTKPVILTMHKNPELVRQAVDVGVVGFLIKEQAVADIAKCLTAVMAGEHFIAPDLAASLYNLSGGDQQKGAATAVDDLTKTQREVLRLIAKGMQTKEIAAEMGVSYRTIENHRHRMAERLGLKGNNSLLRFALKHQDDLS